MIPTPAANLIDIGATVGTAYGVTGGLYTLASPAVALGLGVGLLFLFVGIIRRAVHR